MHDTNMVLVTRLGEEPPTSADWPQPGFWQAWEDLPANETVRHASTYDDGCLGASLLSHSHLHPSIHPYSFGASIGAGYWVWGWIRADWSGGLQAAAAFSPLHPSAISS